MRLKNPKNLIILVFLGIINPAAGQISEESGIFAGGSLGASLVSFIDTITLVEIDTTAQAALFAAVVAIFYFASLNIFEQVFLRLEEIIIEAMGSNSRGLHRSEEYPTGVKGMAFAVAFLSANGITGLIGLLAATAMGLIALLILLIMHGKLLGLLGQFGIDTGPSPETSPTPSPQPEPEPEPEPEPQPEPDDWTPSDGIDVAVKDIISGIEDELEYEQEIMKLDEKVLKDLEKALMYIKNNRGLIDDLVRVKFPEESNDVSHEDLEHEMQAIKNSYNIDPRSKQATETLKNEMQQIHDLLKDALESLKKKDSAIQKLIDYDSNLEQKIDDIDTKERRTLNDAIDNLEKSWQYFQNQY